MIVVIKYLNDYNFFIWYILFYSNNKRGAKPSNYNGHIAKIIDRIAKRKDWMKNPGNAIQADT